MKIGRHQWRTGISLFKGRRSEDVVAGGSGMRANVSQHARHAACCGGGCHGAVPAQHWRTRQAAGNSVGVHVPTSSTLVEEARPPSRGGGGLRGGGRRGGAAAPPLVEGKEQGREAM
jgi:hypothetical protein